MTAPARLLGLAGLCASLAACGGSPAPTPVAMPAPPKPVAVAPVTPSAPAPAPPSPVAAVRPAQIKPLVPPAPAVPVSDAPTYEVKGRRDPFQTLDVVSGPGGLTVASTKLTGIVRGNRASLALVETTDGIGYILKPGDTLGDGRLLEIGADSVVFAVAARPGAPSTRVVLKLAAN
ncbi:MAG TPA: hypothetical protein VGU22_02945 [Methylomirabilota bacterium]|jgi:hypothetical protein|nr:hypothetical protein [Methylomirabilota bacterium]